MRSQSMIRRITRWYAGFMVLIIAIMGGSIFMMSERLTQQELGGKLTQTLNMSENYIRYESGVFEYDERLLRLDEAVSLSIYDRFGNLLYGSVPRRFPIDSPVSETPTSLKVSKQSRYQYQDIWVNVEGYHAPIMVRGIVSESVNQGFTQSLLKGMLVGLPILLAIIIVGGRLLIKNALKPVEIIRKNAHRIVGGDDLKQRIELPESDNEFYKLTETLNEMLERLMNAFDREREFTDDVSHELRTPITGLKLDVDVLLMNPSISDKEKEALLRMQSQIDWMSHLIEDMLLISRGREIELDLEMIPIKEFLEMSTSAYTDFPINLNVSSDMSVEADRSVLSGVIWNLVENSFKYGASNVTISNEETDHDYKLSIIDDGIGMAEDQLDKIWDRFYRVDTVRNSDHTSSGLGLSIVKWGVDLLGWTIEVRSTIDVGTTFTIKIPKVKNL